jgi:hypothetical protein
MAVGHQRAGTKIIEDLHSRQILELLTRCLLKAANEVELWTEAVGVVEARIH